MKQVHIVEAALISITVIQLGVAVSYPVIEHHATRSIGKYKFMCYLAGLYMLLAIIFVYYIFLNI